LPSASSLTCIQLKGQGKDKEGRGGKRRKGRREGNGGKNGREKGSVLVKF